MSSKHDSANLQSAASERALIAAVIEISQRRTAGENLPEPISAAGGESLAAHFSDPGMGRAWTALCRANESGVALGLVSAADTLRSAGVMVGESAIGTGDIVGWMLDVQALASTGIPTLLSKYVQEIRAASLRRGLRAVGQNIIHESEADTGDALKLYDACLESVSSIRSVGSAWAEMFVPPDGQEPKDIREAVLKHVDRATSGSVHKIRTPFDSLNWLFIGGMVGGQLIYLGARPSVGKSALAVQFARSAAGDGIKVLVVLRESTPEAFAARAITQEGKYDASEVATWNERILQNIDYIGERVADLPIVFTSKGRIENIRDAIAEHKPGLVIVDYLQILAAPERILDPRARVEFLSRSLKDLAMENNIPVICLSSLRRLAQSDAEPTMADLRQSGQIEHDGDIILLLHRPEGELNATCIVAKNRDGKTGRIALEFVPNHVSFIEKIEGEE